MALLRYNRYPGYWLSPTTSYPQGAFKNKSSDNADDGSYAEADWLNDWDGFFGRLLTQAGISANGTVDSAQSSQYYDALAKLFPLASLFTGDVSDSGYIQIPVLVNGSTKNILINWLPWTGITGTTPVQGVYEVDNAVIYNWKKPFPNRLLAVLPSVQDTSVDSTKSETVRYSKPTLTTVGLLPSCDHPSIALSGYVIAIGY